MKSGSINLPLHGGQCPPWLFSRMQRLGAAIIEAIVYEFGTDEVLWRLADPYWFQALGCVLGFDWHSSGLTTTVCGALKEGLRPRQRELGLFLAGGKGKTSRKTPQEIEKGANLLGLADSLNSYLIYASKMAAKVDNTALQDGYQLYHHFFIFTKEGKWAVVQQGMNEKNLYARRYHWVGDEQKDFITEPQQGLMGKKEKNVLNMVAKESKPVQQYSLELVNESPFEVLSILKKMNEKENEHNLQLSFPFAKSSKKNTESYYLPRYHAIPQAKRIEKTLLTLYEEKQTAYASFLAHKNVGPATVRALAMVAEIIYGTPPSFTDPVRYSFAHGGKDGHPYPVNKSRYDNSIQILETAVAKAKIEEKERLEALRNLAKIRES